MENQAGRKTGIRYLLNVTWPSAEYALWLAPIYAPDIYHTPRWH